MARIGFGLGVNMLPRGRSDTGGSGPPADMWQDFTLTTGTVADDVYGYADGTSFPETGSINREPNPAHPVKVFYYNVSNQQILAVFPGADLTADLANYTITIDSSEYEFTSNFIFGNTEVTIDLSAGPVWGPDEDHTVEFDEIVVVEPAWREFLLEAGNILDVYVGYLFPGALGNPDAIGSVSPSPNTNYGARGIIDAGVEGYIVQIFGNHVADLTDRVLTINGVQTTRSTEAVYIEADDYTNVQYNSEITERFVDGGFYVCEFQFTTPG